ncbi:hypothetical protein KTO58_02675 [Chitinophaga pendula]|uniref:hypothetical protein n=1 Tax=Chitinophaga TaxID=79328 RepID=UPI000BAFF1FA|nr:MULTISPECIES: hypothetical protein [Chitinophaga]ASZ14252.1 hypothetical protein CK934_26545 [Chitinophaga sp. MD30]UCJ08104.1 hypothetical protein KTO58_02675 [Chitinophaga pendula]
MKKLKSFSNTLSRNELKGVAGGGTGAGVPICFGTCNGFGCQFGGYPDCVCLFGSCRYIPPRN